MSFHFSYQMPSYSSDGPIKQDFHQIVLANIIYSPLAKEIQDEFFPEGFKGLSVDIKNNISAISVMGIRMLS